MYFEDGERTEAKEHRQLLESGKEGLSPRASRRNAALPTLAF